MEKSRATRRLTFSGSSPYSLTPTFASSKRKGLETLDVKSIETLKTRGLEGQLDLRLTDESVIDNRDTPQASFFKEEIETSLEISRVIDDIVAEDLTRTTTTTTTKKDRSTIEDEWERQSYDPKTAAPTARRGLDFEGVYADSPEMIIELSPASPVKSPTTPLQRPGGFLIFSGDDDVPSSLKVRDSPLLIGRNHTQGTLNDLLMTELEIFSVRTDESGKLKVTSKMTTAAFEINEKDAISTGRFTVTYKRSAQYSNSENVRPDEDVERRLGVSLPLKAPVGVVKFPESMLPDKVMIERGADLPYVNPLYLVPSGERITVLMPEDKKFFGSPEISLDHFVIHMKHPVAGTLMKLAIHKLVFAQWVFVPRSVISVRSVVISPTTTVDLLLHVTIRRQPKAGEIYVKITQVDVVVPEDFTELRMGRRQQQRFFRPTPVHQRRGFARNSGDWQESE